MPIPNYTKPQSFVQQYLQVLTDVVAASRNAFIYGPQYRLSRYTNAAEKAETANIAPATVDLLATIASDEIFDSSFVKVFGEDLEIAVGSEVGDRNDTGFYLKSLEEPHKIVYNTDITGTATVTEVPQVLGRDIKVGDFIEITDGGGAASVTRRVTALEQDSGVDSVIVLDGAATLRYVTQNWAGSTDEILSAQVVVKYTGVISSDQYSATTNGVNFSALPKVPVTGATGSPLVVRSGEGTLYLHYRALVQPGANEPIKKLQHAADIESAFGPIDVDNWLAYACSRALAGSAGKTIYATRVREDSVTAYNEVLKKASQNINLYAHCPLTYNIDIQQAVASHVESMSRWDVKRWRRAYVASDVPSSWVLIDKQDGGANFEAQIDSDDGLLTVTLGDVDFVAEGVQPEDIVRTSYVSDGYTEYVVEKVLGPVTLRVKSTPSAELVDEKFEIWKGDTGTAQATYAANRSDQLGTRRVINVWSDNGTRINSDGGTDVVENIFLAAEIAGLRSVALPHQGLTRTEVETISAAPLMYTKYTDDDLDIAAASGVFVITQDLEDGPVYIRHQLTTQADKGSLYYEDSVGVNLDDISFNIVAIIDGYIGKYNATPDTVQVIQNKINELFHNKARADRAQFFIGPQLLDYDPADLGVEIDATFRDQINVKATLTLPLPLNRIIVELFGGVSFNN